MFPHHVLFVVILLFQTEISNKNKKRVYPCEICHDKTYRTITGLQQHKKNIHNINVLLRKVFYRHKCDECEDSFRSLLDLQGHKLKKHKGISCDICGQTFTQSGNMRRHRVRHTGIKEHKCKECPKEFYTFKELKSHMICHTGILPKICEICGKRCRDGGVLTAHMRRHTGERPAKCEVCGKSFFSFRDLSIHAVGHTSERPFPCDTCGARFQRKRALNIHKVRHSGERKHVCNICGKSFTHSSGLRGHRRTHEKAKDKSKSETATNEYIPTVYEGKAFKAVGVIDDSLQVLQ